MTLSLNSLVRVGSNRHVGLDEDQVLLTHLEMIDLLQLGAVSLQFDLLEFKRFINSSRVYWLKKFKSCCCSKFSGYEAQQGCDFLSALAEEKPGLVSGFLLSRSNGRFFSSFGAVFFNAGRCWFQLLVNVVSVDPQVKPKSVLMDYFPWFCHSVV